MTSRITYHHLCPGRDDIPHPMLYSMYMLCTGKLLIGDSIWWLTSKIMDIPMQLTWAKNCIYIQMYIGFIWLYWFQYTEISTIGLLSLGNIKFYGGPLPLRGYPLKVLWPGPATNMLFLQIYQKYFIIEQTCFFLIFSQIQKMARVGRGPGSKRLTISCWF
jgi:hypothetical protein